MDRIRIFRTGSGLLFDNGCRIDVHDRHGRRASHAYIACTCTCDSLCGDDMLAIQVLRLKLHIQIGSQGIKGVIGQRQSCILDSVLEVGLDLFAHVAGDELHQLLHVDETVKGGIHDLICEILDGFLRLLDGFLRKGLACLGSLADIDLDSGDSFDFGVHLLVSALGHFLQDFCQSILDISLHGILIEVLSAQSALDVIQDRGKNAVFQGFQCDRCNIILQDRLDILSRKVSFQFSQNRGFDLLVIEIDHTVGRFVAHQFLQ